MTHLGINKVLLTVIILSTILFSNDTVTNKEMKLPKSTITDFTFQADDADEKTKIADDGYVPETYLDKQLFEVEKIIAQYPRDFSTFQCQTDSYGFEYCPADLAPATQEWDYEMGYSQEQSSEVRDYTTSSPVEHSASVIDYTNKVSITVEHEASLVETIPNPIKLDIPFADNAEYNTNLGYEIVSVDGQSDCGDYFGICGGTGNSLKRFYKNGQVQVNREYQYGKYTITRQCDSSTKEVTTINKTDTIPIGYANNTEYDTTLPGTITGVDGQGDCGDYFGYCGTYGNMLRRFYKNGRIWVNQEYQYGTYTVHRQIDTTIFKCFEYVCPTDLTYNLNKTLGTCSATSIVCPDTYSETSSGNCQKTITYNYYSNTCPVGYNIINQGLTSCPKSDPNTGIDNTSTLDDDCNSLIDPTANCYKDIEYKYYDYFCQDQVNPQGFNWIIGNTGGNVQKSDPDNGSDNTSTLDDPINSSSPPVNNCKRERYTCNSSYRVPAYVNGSWQCSPWICNNESQCGYGSCLGRTPSQDKFMPYSMHPINSIFNRSEYVDTPTCVEQYEYNDGTATLHQMNGYHYYTYTCPDSSWTLVNNVSDPGCVDDTFGGCINFEKQTGNCKRSLNNCQSTAENITTCTQQQCDLAFFNKISYCEDTSCPTTDGIFQGDDGNCYIEMCPSGTTEINGKCKEL